jgi:hypothetical protein
LDNDENKEMKMNMIREEMKMNMIRKEMEINKEGECT